MTEQSVLGKDRLKHLEFIQAVIARLGNNSFLIKGWTLTVAAAVLAVAARQLDWGVAAIGLLPTVTFWLLDGNFLQQERLFRRLYDDVRQLETDVPLMSMNVNRYKTRNTWISATFSPTLALFYGALLLVGLALIIIVIVSR